ncbi:MAG: ferritin [Candidatus Zixiibacteriota bacterium]|nr:MAG: ferritin [candidate division Zixibacteria bacterium]
MMISQKVADKLNEQVKNEFFANWTYLSMAYAFESMNLKIFAKWFFKQAEEEREHAEKIAQYLLDQGAEVKLTALDKPQTGFKSAEEIVAGAVAHEKQVTRNIHDLVDLARAEKDHATENFLQWFIEEQVEEVASTTELLEMVKMAQGPGQLFVLENRLYHMVESKS